MAGTLLLVFIAVLGSQMAPGCLVQSEWDPYMDCVNGKRRS